MMRQWYGAQGQDTKMSTTKTYWCTYCFKPETKTKVRIYPYRLVTCFAVTKEWPLCAGCNRVSYCTSMCQKRHWPQHKTFCQEQAKRKDEKKKQKKKATGVSVTTKCESSLAKCTV